MQFYSRREVIRPPFALARYWATEYDWRKVEARLKALPQFITEIDGREGFAKTDLGPKGITIPVNLVHYNQLAKGGHFAAWEQPTLLVDEMRVGLRSLR